MEEVKRMTNRPYALRIPDGVLQLAELRSHEEHTDKTTALQQWLYAAAEEYAFKRLAEGRLSLSQTAELLDLSKKAAHPPSFRYGVKPPRVHRTRIKQYIEN
jgi:hypothetical protein